MLLGIVVGQWILYGPSLVGGRVLLPLGVLSSPGMLLPPAAGGKVLAVEDFVRSDLVLQFEPERRFATAELAAGRLPLWLPYQYGGVPARFTLLSPFFLLKCLAATPVILAWVQLLQAMVAGLGAYRFFRRGLGVGFWAAAIPSWCYPITGFFVLWQGFPPAEVIVWFPWLLLAADRAIRRPGAVSAAGMAVTICLALTGGQPDVAGLALAATALFAIWRVAEYWLEYRAFPAVRGVMLTLALGWLGGFMLAAPHLLPLLEYIRSGIRMEQHAAGSEERPPWGMKALPEAVLPNLYGSVGAGAANFRLVVGNPMEGPAAASAGVLATLLLAPMAACSRRHRSFTWLGVLFIILGLGWCANLPGLVGVLRLPGFNLLSYNRAVFAAAFAVLALAAVGLDVLGRGEVPGGRRWMVLPALVCAGLCAWCGYRALVLPEPVASGLGEAVRRGEGSGWIRSLEDVRRVQHSFIGYYVWAGTLCGLALAGWLYLLSGRRWKPGLTAATGILLAADLLAFAMGRSPQADPAQYYPRVPVLEAVARRDAGRVLGCFCLPANLAMTQGLQDAGGYDPVDPARYVRLAGLGAYSGDRSQTYDSMEGFTPFLVQGAEGGVRLSPVLDLLGVRYLIGRGNPPPRTRPIFASPDYWVLENPAALPRVFVPRRVETVADDTERLRRLGAKDFDPRAVAFAETVVDLPGAGRGRAEIVRETPIRIEVALHMETAGLLVLADRWDPGWHARLDGRAVPILRVDHALRGVVVPAGAGQLEFYYDPASFRLGLWLCGVAVAALLGGLLVDWRRGGGFPRRAGPW